jgi:hypothetical protein
MRMATTLLALSLLPELLLLRTCCYSSGFAESTGHGEWRRRRRRRRSRTRMAMKRQDGFGLALYSKPCEM